MKTRLSPSMKDLPKTPLVVLQATMLLICAFFLFGWYDVELAIVMMQSELPLARSGVPIERPTAVVAINTKGFFRYSDGDTMAMPTNDPAELFRRLSEIHQTFPERPIMIKARSEVRFELVGQAIAAVHMAGFKNAQFVVHQWY